MAKIVFLEAASLGPDIDLSNFNDLGEVVTYPACTNDQVAERITDADVVIANKVVFNASTLGGNSSVKLVSLTATGTDNLDKPYLEGRGIAWRNVAGYSTEPVAQHTFALFFYLAEHMRFFDDFVKDGGYTASGKFSSFDRIIFELSGKTWGIVGMGSIGQRVAQIATAFGCKVIYTSTSGKNSSQPYEQVSFDELCARADIISMHAPMNEKTAKMFNKDAFRKMKKTAFFLNVARGGVVDDEALAWALENGEIRAAGLDVVSKEPIAADNPLLKIRDSERLVITPHIAWASLEARKRLMDIVYDQVKEFLQK